MHTQSSTGIFWAALPRGFPVVTVRGTEIRLGAVLAGSKAGSAGMSKAALSLYYLWSQRSYELITFCSLILTTLSGVIRWQWAVYRFFLKFSEHESIQNGSGGYKLVHKGRWYARLFSTYSLPLHPCGGVSHPCSTDVHPARLCDLLQLMDSEQKWVWQCEDTC